MPPGRWLSLQRTLRVPLPQQFPNLLHSSLLNPLSYAAYRRANLLQEEVRSNQSLLQMGGRTDRMATKKDLQVNKDERFEFGVVGVFQFVFCVRVWFLLLFFLTEHLKATASLGNPWAIKQGDSLVTVLHPYTAVRFRSVKRSFSLIHHRKKKPLVWFSEKHTFFVSLWL